MAGVTPCFWFDNRIEEAVNFYVSVFRDSRVTQVSRYGENAPQPAGTVLAMSFEIMGRTFQALNGGSAIAFNEAISFVVDCKDQSEVDFYWSRLTADGGQESHCAWLKDRYGVSWQIVPRQLTDYLNDKDAAKAQRVMQVMLKMKKIDIAALDAAANGQG